MGWIVEPTPGMFRLGPYVCQEFRTDTISEPTNVVDAMNRPAFWSMDGQYFILSMSRNWRFMNLNLKLHPTTEFTPTRSLFVHCNVGTSSTVGNQVNDLLREIKYRTHETTDFEPQHIQYLPVRSKLMEIVETRVTETNGDLVAFGTGQILLTLHFKKGWSTSTQGEKTECPFSWRCRVMPTDENFLKIKPIRSRFVYLIPCIYPAINGKWAWALFRCRIRKSTCTIWSRKETTWWGSNGSRPFPPQSIMTVTSRP